MKTRGARFTKYLNDMLVGVEFNDPFDTIQVISEPVFTAIT